MTVEDLSIWYGYQSGKIHDKIELTFGGFLRSALRQDPDVFWSEMRVINRGNRARAAMTAICFSTLNTNAALTTHIRL